MKYIRVVLEIVFIVVFITIFVFVQSSFNEYYDQVKFQTIRVNINDSTHVGFVDKEDILKRINGFNLKPGVTNINKISLEAIERNLANDPYINSVEVYSDVTGTLNVDVDQFVPVMRIIDKDGVSYFIDDSYKIVEYRNYMNLSLPLVSQEDDIIPISYLKSKKDMDEDATTDKQKISYRRIDHLSHFIEIIGDDDLWRSMISQIYLNKKGEVELIPRIGSHTITFCEIDSLAQYDKYLNKLLKFYKNQSGNGAWTQYSNVNLKYEGQVVCKKIKNI